MNLTDNGIELLSYKLLLYTCDAWFIMVSIQSGEESNSGYGIMVQLRNVLGHLVTDLQELKVYYIHVKFKYFGKENTWYSHIYMVQLNPYYRSEPT